MSIPNPKQSSEEEDWESFMTAITIYNFFKKSLFITVMLLSLANCFRQTSYTSPSAEYGILDLTEYKFNNKGKVVLHGDWEFYWKQLYEPMLESGMPVRDRNNPEHYLKLPGVWNDKVVDGERLEGSGFATIRLQVIIPPTEKDLAIVFPRNLYSVHAIWINGIKREWNGIPGDSPDTTNFSEHDLLDHIVIDSRTVEIVVEIANFRGNTRWGGIRSPFYIGNVSTIKTDSIIQHFLSFFIFTGILVIGFYHLSFFWNYRKDKLPIYFAFFCITVSVYSLLTSSAWPILFPKMKPNLIFRLEFIFEMLLTPACYLFLKYLFPKDFSRSLLIFLLGVVSILFILIVSLPISDVSHFYGYSLYIPLIFGSYIMFIVIRAYFLKRKFSGIIMVSVAIIFIFMLNDVLNGLVNVVFLFPYSFPLGLLFFIALHSHMISVRQAEAYKHAEELVDLQKKFNLQSKSQAEERSRIARDIHDSIGSEVTAIMTYVANKKDSPESAIAKMKDQLSGILINIRDIVYLLAEDKKGYDILEGEMLKYIQRLEASNKYKIDFKISPVSEILGIEKSLNTQRIFLELMTNILRHSKANQIRINLTKNHQTVRLSIINNGIAFRWKPTDNTAGSFGLDSISIRCKKMNARIRFFHLKSLNFAIVSVPIK
jgi:signal transduction histidine kinase